MRYLIDENIQTLDMCICNGCGCSCYTYKSNCGIRYDQEQACPKHCWSQVCTTAKVDPFNVDA